MSVRILDNGVAVCGTTHHAEWCATEGLVHDPHMAKIVRENISAGELFVNVGAHIGTLAKVAIDAGAKVLCFEPNPDAVECLRHNLAGSSAGIFNVAIGKTVGTVKFNSLDNAGASFVSEGDGTVVLPLDAFDLPQVATILMDCEGSELCVLQGAEQTINRFHPKMLIELNEGALRRQGTNQLEVCSWLQAHGYKWWPVQANLSPDSPQYDILCTHVKTEQNAESCSTSGPVVKLEPDAETEVRRLAEQIKGFMGGSVATRRVRNILHEVGVIELPYRFRKRKGWKKKKKKHEIAND